MQLHRRVRVGPAHDRPEITPGEPRFSEIPEPEPAVNEVVGDGLPVLRQEVAEAPDSPTLMGCAGSLSCSTIQSIVRSGIFFDVRSIL